MSKPVFTDRVQIEIVARHLDAAIQRYVDHYEIGPWQRPPSVSTRSSGTSATWAHREYLSRDAKKWTFLSVPS